MENSNKEVKYILKDQFKLITEEKEFGPGELVKGFGIEDSTGKVILAFNDSYNLNEYSEGSNALRIHFSIFPNRLPEYIIDINPFNGTFVYKYEEFPLKDLNAMFRKTAGRIKLEFTNFSCIQKIRSIHIL